MSLAKFSSCNKVVVSRMLWNLNKPLHDADARLVVKAMPSPSRSKSYHGPDRGLYIYSSALSEPN